jgi:hypothetical protein
MVCTYNVYGLPVLNLMNLNKISKVSYYSFIGKCIIAPKYFYFKRYTFTYFARYTFVCALNLKLTNKKNISYRYRLLVVHMGIVLIRDFVNHQLYKLTFVSNSSFFMGMGITFLQTPRR